MAKVLVSLVSDQVIQNVQFIKELESQNIKIDRYILISTQKMEDDKKDKCIIEASSILVKQEDIIKVKENSFRDVKEKLKGIKFNADDKIYVNITGGTKIMSNETYDFFKEIGEIFYLTGYNEYSTLTTEKNPLHTSVSLDEYLKSYGRHLIDATKSLHQCLKTYDETNRFFKKFINEKTIPSEISLLRFFLMSNTDLNKEGELGKKVKELKAKIFVKENLDISFVESNFNEATNLNKMLKELDFTFSEDGFLSKAEIKYLTGGWFEEYTYFLIKNELNLSDKQIALNINLKDANGNENEFDVAFIVKNTLHLIECKTSTKVSGENKLSEYIYKLDALRQNLGLFAQAHLFMIFPIIREKKTTKIEKVYFERANVHKITLVDNYILGNTEEINNFLKRFK